MRTLLRSSFAIIFAAIVAASTAANAAADKHAANQSSCQVSFGSSGSRPISVLQVVAADGVQPCAHAVVARIEATLTCSTPALAPITIWPMFSWKSHENDIPKYIGAFDEASGRTGVSMAALGLGSHIQHLRVPVLLPPACCGVGLLQARCL